MGYSESENRLFIEWERLNQRFIRDGVVNEHQFLNKDTKIGYVLKEVNDPKGDETWDLREFIAERAVHRKPTWRNIARWSFGIEKILSQGKVPNWDEVESHVSDEKKRKSTLNSICAFNLKKEPGSHTANSREIRDYVKSNESFLRQQIELYSDFDLFICAGTPIGSLFLDLISPKDKSWQRTNRGIWYKELKGRPLVVYYHHPNARVDDNVLLYGLLDAIDELKPKIVANTAS